MWTKFWSKFSDHKLKITRQETGAAFEPLRELLADERGRLRLLAESELSDLIGVSARQACRTRCVAAWNGAA